MRRLAINSFLIILAVVTVFAQRQSPNASVIQQGLEKETKKLRALRLEIATFGEPFYVNESQPQTQQRFKSGVPLWVHMTMSNRDSEVVTYAISRWYSYRHYSPQLLKDGKVIAYVPKMRKKIDDDTPSVRDSFMGIRIWPYQSERVGALELQEWYGILEPGFYELNLGYSFRRGGPRLTSNTVTFQIGDQ